MMIKSSAILTREDMEKERTPEELALWWEEKNLEFGNSPEGHQYALLKQGLTKKFYDEILPLNLLANILYKDRSDIVCIPDLSNDNFDAIIRDNSQTPPFDLKVEFTYAINGHDDHLRMKYLIEHGHVSLTGSCSYTGTEKTGHNIIVENEVASSDDSLKTIFELIKERAKSKCKKQYGKEHVLVIIVNDYLPPRYDSQEDINALEEFIKSNIINLSLDFGELYILGISGKTLLSLKIGI
jgi:hypothetical protein